MKLIIDIPLRAYVTTKEVKRVIDADNEGVVADAIIKGIPLDNIRAEILEYIDDLDIADAICEVFDKYNVKGSNKE